MSWLKISLPKRRSTSTNSSNRQTESTPQDQLLSESALPEHDNANLPFPIGIKILHDSPKAVLDICFVHGLSGDREGTWTAKGQDRSWPQSFLPEALPDARILAFGYDSNFIHRGVASKNRLLDHGNNLLTNLVTERELSKTSTRPLIFVAHSLGGLVCKVAILNSKNNADKYLHDIFTSIKGVVFLGTPHAGSEMANWAKIPALTISIFKSANRSLLEVLETNNEYLESIQSGFLHMVRAVREEGRALEVTCFYEELPLPTVGLVVTQQSAVFDSFTPRSIYANHMNMVKFSSASDQGFRSVLGELKRWKETLNLVSLPANIFELLRSLSFSKMHERYQNISAATEGTCQWLSQHPEFQSWLANDSSMLWLKGTAGCGKSTLMKSLVDKFERTEKKDVILKFFFYGDGDELQHNQLGMMRSLMHQLLQQAPDSSLDIVELFSTLCREMGEPGKDWNWNSDQLFRQLESSIIRTLNSRPVWLFVDALDECEKPIAIQLIEKLNSLVHNYRNSSSNGHHLRICIACRPYPILQFEPGREIIVSNFNGSDIGIYVQAELKEVSHQTSPDIAQSVIDRAGNVFLLANFIARKVHALALEGYQIGVIEERLYDVPTDLESYYQRAWENMTESSKRLLQCIFIAQQRLTLFDLPWAMATNTEEPIAPNEQFQLNGSTESELARLKRYILSISFGLVEVTEQNTIRSIHQSVKDFFMNTRVQTTISHLTSAEEDAIGLLHKFLATNCIRYMAMVEAAQPVNADFAIFLFLDYASRSWLPHVRESHNRGIDQGYILQYLHLTSGRLFDFWAKLRQMPVRSRRSDYFERTLLIHILCEHGIDGPLRKLHQEKSIYLDYKDCNGETPLSIATFFGHKSTVALLLKLGASPTWEHPSPSWEDSQNLSAIHYAILSSNIDILRCFFEKDIGSGINTNLRDRNGLTPLHFAAWHSKEEVVKYLLDNSADLEAQNKDGQTPLASSVRRSRLETIKLLLNKGANLFSTDQFGFTPLIEAAIFGVDHAIEIFLDAGAELEMSDCTGRTPLCFAAMYGRSSSCRFLLARGANFNVIDRFRRTPIDLAAIRGHEESKQILRNAGARLTSNGVTEVFTQYPEWPNYVHAKDKGKEEMSPFIRTAIENGNVDLIDALLQKKFDLHQVDKDGYTPLTLAVEFGHLAIINLLLRNGGADVNGTDKFGRTALRLVVKKGHLEAVQTLLKVSGIDINKRDSGGRSAFWYAIMTKHEAIKQLLKENGATL